MFNNSLLWGYDISISMSKIEIDWEGVFGGELEPVDPHVQRAIDRFGDALEESKKTQDPILKEVLRKRTINLLHEAVNISSASKMREVAFKKPDVGKN